MKTRSMCVLGAAGLGMSFSHALAVDAQFSDSSNLTGQTSGSATPTGGGAPFEVTGGATFDIAGTTATGSTSGGQVDGPLFARAQYNASIAQAITGGALQITYNYSALSRIDAANYTGGIGTAFINHLVFTVSEQTPFRFEYTGSVGDDIVELREVDGQICDGYLLPGVYEIYHSGGLFAGTGPGQEPFREQSFGVNVTLPTPGAAALGLLGAAYGLRRRRR